MQSMEGGAALLLAKGFVSAAKDKGGAGTSGGVTPNRQQSWGHSR